MSRDPDRKSVDGKDKRRWAEWDWKEDSKGVVLFREELFPEDDLFLIHDKELSDIVDVPRDEVPALIEALQSALGWRNHEQS